MAWSYPRGQQWRRRLKAKRGGRSRSESRLAGIELVTVAAGVFGVLLVGAASGGVFAAVSRQLFAPFEAVASSAQETHDAARQITDQRFVYYRSCAAARAAGAAPIARSMPGYRLELDRDNDGWACEAYLH